MNTIHHQSKYKIHESTEIILIGAGIMSITLGMLITILEPNWNIHIYERLSKPAQESSNFWNNAGTGHAAFCELNYTEYNTNQDTINIKKALSINSDFELSLQFWAYLIKNNILHTPQKFIQNIPHMSLVWGSENIYFLKKRFQTLKNHIQFRDMVYSENLQQIHSWIPLTIQGRSKNQKIAVTRMETGTDINFGEITNQLLFELKKKSNFKIYLQHDVTSIQHDCNNTWSINVIDLKYKQKKCIQGNYVFIGAGGKSLNLLQTSGIPEVMGYAGFPVGGQFLITKNPQIIKQHSAKVYGKASLNTPPMSVPHIDTRVLNGNKILLFGPFATFSSKFLKYGSWLDLFRSLNKNNFIPMIQAGIDNFDLVKYLINQLIMSKNSRINALKEYYPQVNPKDWSLIQAGQRVQIIKKKQNRGILQFGTEIISSSNHTLSALLGASPGASTAVAITIKILQNMFSDKIYSHSWKTKLTDMIPSYNQNISNDQQSINQSKKTRHILNLI